MRHTHIADAYARQLAAGGRLANLDRALEVCDEVLESADGSTIQASALYGHAATSWRDDVNAARPTLGGVR